MAINKKLIHFQKKENFDKEVANENILDYSIVFIQDSKEISTHGEVYKSINWSILGESSTFEEPSTFWIDVFEFQFEEGMNFYDFINSEYNTQGITAWNDDNVISFGGNVASLQYEDGSLVSLLDPIRKDTQYYFEMPLP